MAARRVPLTQVRRRLELLLKAQYGRGFEIATTRSRPIKWWERWFSDVRDPSRSPEPVAAIDAEVIPLPHELAEAKDAPSPEERYRLLALAAAEREVRGTIGTHATLKTQLERELFWIAEGTEVDAVIAKKFPALIPALGQARRRILASRPDPRALSPQEREVEDILKQTLTRQSSASTASAERPWRADADRIARLPGGYSGIAPVGHWGACPQEAIVKPDANPMLYPGDILSTGIEIDMEGDTDIPDPENRQRGEESNEATDDDPDRPSLGAGNINERIRPRVRRIGTPHKYPEWDCRKHRFIPEAVTVWTSTAVSTVADVPASPTISRELKAHFLLLRAHRESRRRQYSGDSLDLPAVVDGLVDLRMGRNPDERVYQETRVNRPSLAIALLVDISGSTGNQLGDGQRIIDLEKTALLMAHEGLEAVGDPYGIFAFSSLGTHDVQVLTVKAFEERGAVVSSRVHSLAPDQNTRLGAAIRHVTQLLTHQPASHQLLLVITDGRPSDIAYDEEYGVGDTHRAILDARNRGVAVFGLAIDTEEHEYLAELFGASGYVWLRDPHALGRQLLRCIGMLLRS